MKRPLFIIIGITFVIILVAVWVYILFFKGQDADQNSFTDLNFGDTTDTTYAPTTNNDTSEQAVVDVSGPEKLRQLTTRPVVGYQDVMKNASSTPLVYYVESGTGHIFSIDLTSGEEKRLSGTTIPSSRHAAITPNGQYVMLQSGTGNGAEFVVGEFSSTSESISVGLIDEMVVSFAETTDNTFLYAAKMNNSVVGKEYDPAKGTAKTLFTIPFREAVIQWGSSVADAHYVYPKASYQLEGYAYRVSKGILERLPVSGYGLSLAGSADEIIYSKQIDSIYQSFLYNSTEDSTNQAPITVIPEKCTALHNDSKNIICGALITTYDYTMPDSWYKGTVTFSDELWQINTASGVGVTLVNISNETGRAVDAAALDTSSDDQRLYFINSLDNKLWMFELPETTN
jgi:hypothetical protein